MHLSGHASGLSCFSFLFLMDMTIRYCLSGVDNFVFVFFFATKRNKKRSKWTENELKISQCPRKTLKDLQKEWRTCSRQK